MKNFLFFEILVCIIFIIGCNSFGIRPLIISKNTQNKNINSILKYKIIPSRRSLREQALLKKSIKELKIIEISEVNKFQSQGLFLEIKIKYLGRDQAGGQLISAATLGIIPAYMSERDMYGFDYKLYYNSKLIKEKKYVLRMKQFTWILAAPWAIANYCREKKEIYKITHDFFSEVNLGAIK